MVLSGQTRKSAPTDTTQTKLGKLRELLAPGARSDDEIEAVGRIAVIAEFRRRLQPGIGKSRLTAALSQAIRADRHTRLRYFCSPHHQDSALYPFITQLEHAAQFARDA
jgi:hypothetical protein